MVMAVKLIRPSTSSTVLVLSGYEGGLTAVHQLPLGNPSSVQPAHLVYLSQPHTQPILSLDVSPDATTYFTSSADATIAAHRIPELSAGVDRTESGAIQDEACSERSTELALGSEPVIEAGKLAQDEVLPSVDSSQDKRAVSDAEAPSLSFAKRPVVVSPSTTAAPPAGLSSLLSSAPRLKSDPPPPIVLQITIQPAHKTFNTKHAGQQSLRVRSDGRILATGGWDSRIRIYSSKTLREVAVLKWHKEGVYAVDFAQVLEPGDLSTEDQQGQQVMALTNKSLGNLQRQREQQMQLKHWIVAGAKDGKVSLWEVF
jgi:WD40 repeat protein